MNADSEIYGVILAGGSGARLWPLSREMYPKQLLRLNNENTLFQSTFLRLSQVIPAQNVVTVANVKHAGDVRLQLDELNSLRHFNEDLRLIIEPVGKNTAPAIGLSVLYILKKLAKDNSNPVILVAPSDHLIKDTDKFAEAVSQGIKLAQHGCIVTFGIKPDKPDTGYGYVNTVYQDSISQIVPESLGVLEFKEKPDHNAAGKYVESGTHFWNSGIFMFTAQTLLKELQLHSKDILDNLMGYEFSDNGPTVGFDEYSRMPEISIDYAIMEHSQNIALIPIDCGWNDMGSWEAIFDLAQKDDNNNFISGNVLDIDSENSLIYGTSKLISTIGLKDTVIVETEDAILACDKSRTQDVKKIFENLKQNNDLACIVHKTVYRPWGYYTVLQRGEGYLIKIIQVNPEAKLSLQMHHHRSEHWVVLSGNARVVKDNEEIYLEPGNSIDIPATMKHSLANSGKTDLKIIEIQKGDYLEEDDIVRFEDIYGRVTQI